MRRILAYAWLCSPLAMSLMNCARQESAQKEQAVQVGAHEGTDLVSPGDGGTYVISSAYNGKAIDLPASTATLGAAFTQYPENEHNNQQFTLKATGANQYQLVNEADGDCVDLGGSGSLIVQQTCVVGKTSQQWVISTSGNNFVFTNASNNTCLDLAGFSTADGGAIGSYQCNGQQNQQWALKQISASTILPVVRDCLLGLPDRSALHRQSGAV